MKVCDMKRFYAKGHSRVVTRALLDDREKSLEELDEDLVAVLQFKTYVVRLHPCKVLEGHKEMLFLHKIHHLFVCLFLTNINKTHISTPHLQQVEVSVELRALGVFQSL